MLSVNKDYENNEILIEKLRNAQDETTYQIILDELMNKNASLVSKIAEHYVDYVKTGVYDIDDFKAEGNLALYDAILKFDKHRGVKFSTYAYSYIRGRILRFMYNNMSSVHFPCYYIEQSGKIWSYLIDHPTDSSDSICDALHITPEELIQYQSDLALQYPIYYDAISHNDDSDGDSLIANLVSNDSMNYVLKDDVDTILQKLFSLIDDGYQNIELDKILLSKFLYKRQSNTEPIDKLAIKYNIPKSQILNRQRRIDYLFTNPQMRRNIKDVLGVPQNIKDVDVCDYLFANN